MDYLYTPSLNMRHIIFRGLFYIGVAASITTIASAIAAYFFYCKKHKLEYIETKQKTSEKKRKNYQHVKIRINKEKQVLSNDLLFISKDSQVSTCPNPRETAHIYENDNYIFVSDYSTEGHFKSDFTIACVEKPNYKENSEAVVFTSKAKKSKRNKAISKEHLETIKNAIHDENVKSRKNKTTIKDSSEILRDRNGLNSRISTASLDKKGTIQYNSVQLNAAAKNKGSSYIYDLTKLPGYDCNKNICDSKKAIDEMGVNVGNTNQVKNDAPKFEQNAERIYENTTNEQKYETKFTNATLHTMNVKSVSPDFHFDVFKSQIKVETSKSTQTDNFGHDIQILQPIHETQQTFRELIFQNRNNPVRRVSEEEKCQPLKKIIYNSVDKKRYNVATETNHNSTQTESKEKETQTRWMWCNDDLEAVMALKYKAHHNKRKTCNANFFSKKDDKQNSCSVQNSSTQTTKKQSMSTQTTNLEDKINIEYEDLVENTSYIEDTENEERTCRYWRSLQIKSHPNPQNKATQVYAPLISRENVESSPETFQTGLKFDQKVPNTPRKRNVATITNDRSIENAASCNKKNHGFWVKKNLNDINLHTLEVKNHFRPQMQSHLTQTSGDIRNLPNRAYDRYPVICVGQANYHNKFDENRCFRLQQPSLTARYNNQCSSSQILLPSYKSRKNEILQSENAQYFNDFYVQPQYLIAQRNKPIFTTENEYHLKTSTVKNQTNLKDEYRGNRQAHAYHSLMAKQVENHQCVNYEHQIPYNRHFTKIPQSQRKNYVKRPPQVHNVQFFRDRTYDLKQQHTSSENLDSPDVPSNSTFLNELSASINRNEIHQATRTQPPYQVDKIHTDGYDYHPQHDLQKDFNKVVAPKVYDHHHTQNCAKEEKRLMEGCRYKGIHRPIFIARENVVETSNKTSRESEFSKIILSPRQSAIVSQNNSNESNYSIENKHTKNQSPICERNEEPISESTECEIKQMNAPKKDIVKKLQNMYPHISTNIHETNRNVITQVKEYLQKNGRWNFETSKEI